MTPENRLSRRRLLAAGAVGGVAVFTAGVLAGRQPENHTVRQIPRSSSGELPPPPKPGASLDPDCIKGQVWDPSELAACGVVALPRYATPVTDR